MDYFLNINGHDKVVEYLKKTINTGEVSHAYLFLGPPGVGKMQTALAFAHMVISLSDNDAQKYANQMIHPDLKILQKPDDKTKITREQIINDIEQWLSIKPYRARHRVVIVRDAHLMTMEAANALLKTLEEPPHYTIIILIADNNSVLETITSRCNVINFASLTAKQIEQFLLKRGDDEKKAYSISLLAQGSIANAIKLGEQENVDELWNQAADIIQEIFTGDVEKVITAAESFGDNSELLISTIETILRDILIYKESQQLEYLYFSNSIKIIDIFKDIKSRNLEQAITDINSLKKYYHRNINTLVLNINICYKIRDAIKTNNINVRR